MRRRGRLPGMAKPIVRVRLRGGPHDGKSLRLVDGPARQGGICGFGDGHGYRIAGAVATYEGKRDEWIAQRVVAAGRPDPPG